MCFFWPHLTSPQRSPRPACIQRSLSSRTAIVECRDMGWGGLTATRTPVGSCWQLLVTLQPFWPFWQVSMKK